MCMVCDARGAFKKNYQLMFGSDGEAPLAGASTGGADVPQMASTPTVANSATGNPNIDAVLAGRRYSVLNLTFSFPQLTTDYETNYGNTTEAARTALLTFAPVTPAMQAAARFVFSQASALTGLTITESTQPLQSNFRLGLFTPASDGSGTQTAFAYLPTSSNVGGDSWYSNTDRFTAPARGNYAWTTMLHEIGHNLGLVHGHETDGISGASMTADRNSMEFSVMTYRSYIGSTSAGYRNERWGYAQTFMMYDIAALQHMYGADYTLNADNSVYAFSPVTGELFINGVGQGAPGGNRVFMTIWDGGGTDTYDFSGYSEAANVDLRAGGWSKFSSVQTANLGDGNMARANVFNALTFRGNLASLIENAIGTALGDRIFGNQASNLLEGRLGNDTLNGGSGGDVLQGGEGDDVLIGDYSGVVTVIDPGVRSTGPSSQTFALGGAPTSINTAVDLTNNFSLNADPNIQNATTELHTTVKALGNGAAHWYAFTILAANVTLTIDIDETTGGLDSYIRLAIELPPSGVGSGVSFTEVANNDDSDTVAGAGGSTAQTDSYLSFTTQTAGRYYVIVGTYGETQSVAQDVLAAGTGYTMHISVAARSNVSGDSDGGTAGNDNLQGGAGSDTLDGGLGADILNGGDGYDYATYINSSTGLTLFMGGGTFNSGEANGDTHTSIEGLIGSQFADIVGGDGLSNELHGINGNDWLYGQGGDDRLIGGNGNDVLSGGLGADRLEGGADIDVAFYRDATSAVSGSLLTGGTAGEAAGDTYFDVENIWGSRFDDVLVGNNGAGQVYGFEGNDNLSGLDGDDFFYGGQGFDTLTGGAGVDNFFLLSWRDQVNAFGTPEPFEGGDTYTDFTSGTDRIILSRFWFGFGNIQGPAAALTETHANFVTNGAAATSRPSLIWNTSNRTLLFDPDGTGSTQSVLIGTFQQGASLTLNDIWTA